MLPPGGGGDGCTEQDHPPANVYRGRDEDTPSHVPYEQTKKHRQEQPQRAASLPDDIVIEILSRVHYKSLCRFKCVSKPWLALCSDLDIHSRAPQTVSGFFGEYNGEAYNFHDLTGGTGHPPLVDPTLSFLGRYEHISIQQCCGGGLLLCKCWESRSQEDKYSYVVCNPVTEKWTVLPPIEFPDRVDGHRLVEDRLVDLNRAERFLGFNALNPSSFVVVVPMTIFELVEVAIYSSETGRWNIKQSQWSSQTMLMDYGNEANLLNGRIHFTSDRSSIVTVDTKGEIWREFKLPNIHGLGTIGQSHGYLHYWRVDNDYQLSIWILEDYGSANWTIKHTVNILELFGKNYPENEDEQMPYDIAIHPDYNLIFLTGWDMTISYDMDSRKVHVICASKEFMFGVPFIPCFAKWSSEGH